MMNAGDYLQQSKELLPRGLVWDSLREPGTTFEALLAVIADSFARIDTRIDSLLDETDPRTVLELIDDFEEWVGLPDSCITVAQTLAQRRDNLHAQLTNDNGQSQTFFIGLAAALGFVITITEFTPALCSTAVAGDPACNSDWYFAWQVNAPATTITYALAGSAVAGDPVRAWGNQMMECMFNKLVHSHRVIIFSYGG